MAVWRKPNDLSYQVFKLTELLPLSEDYGLTSQIRRPANSISANIVEAFGWDIKKDKRNFYIIARGLRSPKGYFTENENQRTTSPEGGSAFETQSHLLYGKSIGYFARELVTDLTAEYQDLIHQLNKILKTLRS